MITKEDQDKRDAIPPDPNSAHRTPEARALNPDRLIGSYHYTQSDRQARRRALLVVLPPGRILDAEHLAHVMDQSKLWSVHHGPRQLLMEAGKRALAGQLVLSAAELAQLEEYQRTVDVHPQPETSGPRVRTKNPVSPYPAPASSS